MAAAEMRSAVSRQADLRVSFARLMNTPKWLNSDALCSSLARGESGSRGPSPDTRPHDTESFRHFRSLAAATGIPHRARRQNAGRGRYRHHTGWKVFRPGRMRALRAL